MTQSYAALNPQEMHNQAVLPTAGERSPGPTYQSLMAVIIVLAAALRIYGVGGAAIWWDEGFSHRWATMPIGQMVRETHTQDFNPPLYYLMLNTWVRFFGDSEASMRMPSVVFSTLSVWLTWEIGRRLVKHREAALAALLMAVSSYQIAYAHEARAYALFMAMFLTSLLSLLKLLKTWDRETAFIYVGSTVLMFYAHVYSVFFFAAECVLLIAVWHGKKPNPITRMRAAIIMLMMGVLLLPWAAFALTRAKAAQQAFWIAKPTPAFIARGLGRQTGSHILLYVIVVFIGLALVQLTRLWRTRAKRTSEPGQLFSRGESISLLAVLLVTPHLLPIIVSMFLQQSIYVDRYAIAAMPAMFLLAAVGADVIRRRAVFAACSAAMVVLAVVNLVQVERTPRNIAAKQLANYVDSAAGPNDVLVFDGPCGGGGNTFNYYSRKPQLHRAVVDWGFADVDEEYLARLAQAVGDAKCFWLITLDRPKKLGAVESALEAQFPQPQRWPLDPDLKHMAAVRFVRATPTTTTR